MSSEAKRQEDEELMPHERALLEKWGEFYRSLADGSRQAQTDEQLHFALACRGLVPAETEHEVAYLKHIRARGLPRSSSRAERPRTPKQEVPRRMSKVPEATVSVPRAPDTPEEPRKTEVSLSEFKVRCVHLRQRFTWLSAAGVDHGSALIDRAHRVQVRAEERGYVARGDLGETRSLERRAESMEKQLAAQPKVDKSIEHEKWTGGTIKIGGGGRGWADYEPGTPRPGWFTDDDYRKSRSNRASELKRRNVPED